MSWISTNHRNAVLVSFGLALHLGCTQAHHDNQVGDDEATGVVGFALTLSDSIHLDRLDWSIRRSDDTVLFDSEHHAPGPILLQGSTSPSTAFQIGGIPVGEGYRVTLFGNTSSQEACTGTSEPFAIVAGTTTATGVSVVCGTMPDAGVAPGQLTTGSVFIDAGVTLQVLDVDAGSVTCPVISELSASPLTTPVGGQPVALHAVADGPVATYRWTQSPTVGSFSDPSSLTPTFACDSAGSTTLTLTISLPDSALCAGQAYTSMSITVVCGDRFGDSDRPPGSACTAASQCAGYTCSGGFCGPYAESCLALRQLGAPPREYLLATNSIPGKTTFRAYCPTGSPWLAPVGVAQAEVGAPPATRSFVGAVGYDFNGVDFSGAMGEGGYLNWDGQPVAGQQDVLELADGSLLTTTSWADWSHTDYSLRHYPIGGPVAAPSSFNGPQGLIQLFDGHILVGANVSHIVSKTGTDPVQFDGATTSFPIQISSGKVLIPAASVNQVILRNPDGTLSGTYSDPSLTESSPRSALQLPDGTIVVGQTGRLRYFTADLAPRPFTAAPSGMTLNADGSISRVAEMPNYGSLLQLPNGQILHSPAGGPIIRLNADGSYVDSYTIPSTYGSASLGMTLDHHGRLLVTLLNPRVVAVVTFPGCSDGTRNGSETDIDCGGTCTVKCSANQVCAKDTDCASGICLNQVCQPSAP